MNHLAIVIVDWCKYDLTISVTFLFHVKQVIVAWNVFILKIKNMEGYSYAYTCSFVNIWMLEELKTITKKWSHWLLLFCRQNIFLARKLSWQLIVECAQVHNFLDVKHNAHKMGQTDTRWVIINLNLDQSCWPTVCKLKCKSRYSICQTESSILVRNTFNLAPLLAVYQLLIVSHPGTR